MFEKLISPAMAVKMIKGGIEKTLGQPVTKFDIIYLADSNQILFKVYGVKLPNGSLKDICEPLKSSNSALIAFAIKNTAKSNLTKDETLDIVNACYFEVEKEPLLNLDIFVTKNGEKIKHSILNHKP